MFNPIIDRLPDEFRGVKVKTDFKQALKFFRIGAAKELNQREKAVAIMIALFESSPPDCADLWDFIEYYVSGGAVDKGASGERLFDFNVDAGRLYAAFLQVYKIELRSADMHWWVFLELYKALPRGTHLSEVIEIRGRKIEKGMSEESKRQLRKAQRTYRIEQEQKSLGSFFKG